MYRWIDLAVLFLTIKLRYKPFGLNNRKSEGSLAESNMYENISKTRGLET